MTDQEQLKARIDELSPMGVRFVARMVDALADPPQASPKAPKPTWITSEPDWVEYFGLMISVHHGVAGPLGLLSFETAFRGACEAVGWSVEGPGTGTQRFIDVTVRAGAGIARKLSLKSTAAQRLSESSAHISKLTEAAWIQDVRTARDRRNRTLQLFQDYCAAVDSIIMLRAFRAAPTAMPHRYQLVEIPTAIFATLPDAPVDVFAADGPVIDCAYRGVGSAARVYLDRSDAKVTVRSIDLSICEIHAEWELVGPD